LRVAEGPQESGSGPRWYAVRVKSRHEKKVCAGLSGAGMEVFLPLHTSLRRWSDRMQRVELPLFPGYVFVRCEMRSEQKLALLRSSRSVVEVLGVRGQPVPVPDREVESVRLLLAWGTGIEGQDGLAAGAPVVVVAGPLAGVVGVVVEQRGARRIVCSIPILGRSVLSDLPAGDVVPYLG